MTDSLLLADEVFLIALDDRTGRFRQHLRAVALGLAGALMAELMLAERVVLHGGTVVAANRQAPADALAHVTLDHVAGESARHSLRTWLTFFAHTSVDRVGTRLERAGLIQRTTSRRITGREVRWMPHSSAEAATPGFRVGHLLRNERPHDVAQAALAGLVDAAGLSRSVLAGASARTVQYRDFVVSTLPPDLAALLQATRSAVADTALAHHA